MATALCLFKPPAAASSPLPRNSVLRLISWNIDFSTPSHAERTTAALDYLSSLFISDMSACRTVLMLQEMTAASLAAILVHPWVKDNFAISDYTPPLAHRAGPGARQRYFTLLLVDRRLVTGEWFRVGFPGSRYGRDVLGVDVQIESERGSEEAREAQDTSQTRWVRICTTHLESLPEEPGREQRPEQLRVVADLLKEESVQRGEGVIVGGVVGGDMNAISKVDEGIHRRGDIGLSDAWGKGGEDEEGKEQGEIDASFGRADGHTWGYQPRGRWPPRRFDKFFYTGNVKLVGLEDIENSGGKVGRLGVDAKIENGMWISDHFGIALSFKVV